MAILLRFPKKKKSEKGHLGGTLLRSGHLEVRIAETKREIRKAQRLRYKVFYEEGGATPDRTAAIIRRDICRFDRLCDHLIVVDHSVRNRFGARKPKVVGAYRLLRQEIAEKNFGFYSAQEFDIAPMLARHSAKNFVELGRSCVAKPWRSKRTLELLWRGIGVYIDHYRIDAMFGCASFHGANPADHARALAFLAQGARSPEDWRVGPLPGKGAPAPAIPAEPVEARKALGDLPPLIKGYLRCGATFGDGAVVDAQFGTTDVFVVMPVADLDQRMLGRFGAQRESAADAA